MLQQYLSVISNHIGQLKVKLGEKGAFEDHRHGELFHQLTMSLIAGDIYSVREVFVRYKQYSGELILPAAAICRLWTAVLGQAGQTYTMPDGQLQLVADYWSDGDKRGVGVAEFTYVVVISTDGRCAGYCHANKRSPFLPAKYRSRAISGNEALRYVSKAFLRCLAFPGASDGDALNYTRLSESFSQEKWAAFELELSALRPRVQHERDLRIFAARYDWARAQVKPFYWGWRLFNLRRLKQFEPGIIARRTARTDALLIDPARLPSAA